MRNRVAVERYARDVLTTSMPRVGLQEKGTEY